MKNRVFGALYGHLLGDAEQLLTYQLEVVCDTETAVTSGARIKTSPLRSGATARSLP